MNTDLDAVDSTSNDVAAAFKAAEASAPAAETVGQPRDPAGRFQSPSGAALPAPGGPPALVATDTATPTPVAAPEAAPAVPEPAAAGTPAPLTLDPSKPPQGWRPEMKEKWSGLPEDIRQEVIRREEASAQGVSQLREYYQPMETLYEGLTKHDQYFDHIDRNPIEYLDEVIQVEQTLTLGNPAQKMQTLLDLGDRYGVPLRQVVDAAMGGQLDMLMQQSHKHHNTPPTLPPEIARELQELRSNQARMTEQTAQSELNDFLSIERPFFQDVAGDMEQLLDSGFCKTYQDAYDTAVWRNPATRDRAIAMINGQNQMSGVAARQAVAGRVSTPSPAALAVPASVASADTTEDAVRAAFVAASRGGVS